MSTRLQSRLAKVAATLEDTGSRLFVTSAPADKCAGDVLRELGIVLGDRDQHIHLHKFFAAEPAKLVAVHCG